MQKLERFNQTRECLSAFPLPHHQTNLNNYRRSERKGAGYPLPPPRALTTPSQNTSHACARTSDLLPRPSHDTTKCSETRNTNRTMNHLKRVFVSFGRRTGVSPGFWRLTNTPL